MMSSEFDGRKIGLLGIGREGQAARAYLRSAIPDLELTLLSESPPARSFGEQLKECDHLVVGPLAEAGLEAFDILIRSPGVSPYRRSIQQARAAGVRITTPSSMWFADHADAQTICVTGTKGKSTTSALLAHALRSCGLRTRLAGNIGQPLLACDDRAVDWWVIELSSFQLTDLEASPTVSVILNLSPEHLDWHGGERAYREDKLRLIKLAGEGLVVANAADPTLEEYLSGRANLNWFNRPDGIHVRDHELWEGNSRLDLRLPEGLPGIHNLKNTAAALTVLRALGADMEAAVESISSFRSLPHRLQFIGERDGVGYINDSISSTPLATAAALEALAGREVTLIVGGLDRGVDWSPYMESFRTYAPRAVVTIPDNGPRIAQVLAAAGVETQRGCRGADDLAAAVLLARRLTRSGGVVLLSPGAPSFPQFRDFRERGLRFARYCGFTFEDREAW